MYSEDKHFVAKLEHKWGAYQSKYKMYFLYGLVFKNIYWKPLVGSVASNAKH